ncbi:MAG: nuclear transport factor 2 family protein [Actinotalea sp.]|nr:nuclear transport factor 2 family protein [Actinotalea sp.]
MLGAVLLVTQWRRQMETSLARRDVDAAVATFTPDAVLEFAGTSSMAGTRTGTAELRAWYARWFGRMERLEARVGRVAVSRPWALGLTNTVMAELTVDETTREGVTAHVDALAVFDVVRGRVRRLRVYLLDERPDLAVWGRADDAADAADPD